MHYLMGFSGNIQIINYVSFIIKINNNAKNVIVTLIYWSEIKSCLLNFKEFGRYE